MGDQEISLKRAVLEAENAVREREDLERRVKVLEAELEQAEDRADTFSQQFKNAESENTQLTSSLKAFQAADDQAAVKEADLEDQVAKYSSVNKEMSAQSKS